MSREQPAREIACDLLDRTRLALLTGDFDSFTRCFELPQYVELIDARHYLETEAQMREVFKALVTNLRNAGVTRMERTCTAADWKTDDIIEFVYESVLWGRDGPMLAPFANFCMAKRFSNDWKITYSLNSLPSGMPYAQALDKLQKSG